jgi:hypothetical protein
MIHFLLPASQPQEKSRLFPDNLTNDLTAAGSGIEVNKDDLLPGAERKFAIDDWDGQ